MSNILKVFGKKDDQRDPEEPCLNCLISSAAIMTVGGGYLASGLVFRGAENTTTVPYRVTIRSAGVAVSLYGVYRAFEAYNLYQSDGWGGFQ